jgi:SAM-dependent methyltransferase
MDMPVEADAFRFPRPSRENLPRLARLAYDAAAVHCRDCRNYHTTWPLLRAAGLSGAGPEHNYPLHIEILSRLLAGRRNVRWLLAGSADAGVLAMAQGTAEALPGTHHAFTIVDHCETPLTLCRSHAADQGLVATTVNADLMAFEAPGAFDIVIGHQLLLFFRDEDRVPFFRQAASWLAPGGRLCLTVYDRGAAARPRAAASADLYEWRVRNLRADVAAGRILLPEDIEAFIARLDKDPPRANGERQFGVDHYVGLLREAGFSVEAVPLPDAEVRPFGDPADRVRYLLAAEPQ